jgi:hypothetical protein
MSQHIVKTGRLLLISHGAYSSYERVAWFVAVNDFEPQALFTEYLDAEPKRRERYSGFNYEDFIAWLSRKGVIAECEEFFDEWYLGDYGSADECAFLPRKARST